MVFRIIYLILAIIAVSAASSVSRIVGGTPTTIFDYPFLVSVEYYNPGSNTTVQRCVGSLISSWHVLTSAYCFTDANQENVGIRAGSTTSLFGGSVVRVAELIIHPDYVENPRVADIAIVVLATPLIISPTVNVVYIPPQQTYIPAGYPVEIISWGFEADGGSQLTSLEKIDSNVLGQEQCAAAYESIESVTIYDQVLCAASNGTSICSADSGAPLIIGEILAGLSSYYVSCDDSTPDVFTRIDRHTGWILEHAVPPAGRTVSAPVRVARSVL
ncbi:trypsin alpha-like [Achroia grisella]|uniref:trypsin alpha-like n=1 Tax=Achroia grisella TaxID=688607 RepID=UPI0027D2ACD1|nr:trypsin alpha-like [Achroia grisella]